MANPAVFNGNGAIAVMGTSNTNTGVEGRSTSKSGVAGISSSSSGVFGLSGSGVGIDGSSSSNIGVFGRSSTGWGVHGRCFGNNTAVFGHSGSDQAANDPNIRTGWGVDGHSPNNVGVHGGSIRSTGVFGTSETGFGVHGATTNNRAVFGHGLGENGVGVWGTSDDGVAVLGESDNGTAGRFEGFVEVLGDLTVAGRIKKQGGGFRVDHPRDPANKYLNHSFVESDKMKNVYDGVAELGTDGTASVDLPEWFEALNGDFRYQLTPVGGAAPNLHVAEEISENRFKIAGGEGGMKVCWQVTGSRKDPWAAANSFEVEEEKPQEERGRYLEPALHDAPEEQSVMIASAPVQPAPAMSPGFEPPQAPEMPPQPPAMSPGLPEMPTGVTAPSVGGMEEEHRRQIDELRGQIEELRRDSLEEEIDDLRRQIKKLRRRR
jgi:hypothetical protein